MESILDLPGRFIIYDTEYTTWEGAPERKWSGPGEHRELVQIGAIVVDGIEMRELESFEILMRPRLNPALSGFFVSLTGITQEQVDRYGVEFPQAWDIFSKWLHGLPAYSYGRGDLEVLKENCGIWHLEFRLDESFFRDICPVFDGNGIDTSQYHSSTIVTAFGSTPRKESHTGLSDSRSILDALKLLRAVQQHKS